MSYAIIRQLLEVRLNALGGNMPTAWENVPYKPIIGTAWQKVNLLPAETDNPTMGPAEGTGTALRRESGIFQVTLYYPVNEGAVNVASKAEALRTHFKRGTVLTQGAVRLTIDTTPSIGPGLPADGFFVVPVSIPYRADVLS